MKSQGDYLIKQLTVNSNQPYLRYGYFAIELSRSNHPRAKGNSIEDWCMLCRLDALESVVKLVTAERAVQRKVFGEGGDCGSADNSEYHQIIVN